VHRRRAGDRAAARARLSAVYKPRRWDEAHVCHGGTHRRPRQRTRVRAASVGTSECLSIRVASSLCAALACGLTGSESGSLCGMDQATVRAMLDPARLLGDPAVAHAMYHDNAVSLDRGARSGAPGSCELRSTILGFRGDKIARESGRAAAACASSGDQPEVADRESHPHARALAMTRMWRRVGCAAVSEVGPLHESIAGCVGDQHALGWGSSGRSRRRAANAS
jgi:hypothetical protein